MEKVIIGKKVLLFPFEIADVSTFIQLHREDKNGYLQKYCLKNMTEEEAKTYLAGLLITNQILIFTGMTKEGKASRRAGFVYITDISDGACSISGVMDKEFSKGLTKQLRKEKYTFSEDTVRTMVDWCFKNFLNMQRIEADILEKNKTALALIKRCGFIKEGTLREYTKIDDHRENVVIWSILRNEWENGKTKIA